MLNVEKKYINQYIRKSIKYIDDNLNKRITIDEICKSINLSKYYFSRMFKSQLGITPYRYILNRKMEEVKKDLLEDIDINTIVSNYDFYDLSHLNKSFVKIYKITPLEFQDKYRNKNLNK
ncbi:MAG: AraC family transcriptional regulator [Terrisporobacter sp.]|uniref:helix-turn-helix domain-containing protein n=1 Tax=Terrisporobacter sp. TaxID=1965305 RepID=UPI002FCAAEB8